MEMPMRVAKWGNSLALRLPASVVETLGLKEGDDVEVVIAGTHRFEVARDDTRAQALARLKALRRPLPKGFRFDRNEVHER
jgi:antitoxin MazE